MHEGRIRCRFGTAKLAALAVVCACLCVCVTSCDRAKVVVQRELNVRRLRSDVCAIWVVTNRLSGEVRFVGHALNSGYVPILGEGDFASLEALASAIKKGTFGRHPGGVWNGFPGVPEPGSEMSDRPFGAAEIQCLRNLGIQVEAE